MRVVSRWTFENVQRQSSIGVTLTESIPNIADDGTLYVELLFTDGTSALMRTTVPAPGAGLALAALGVCAMGRRRRETR